MRKWHALPVAALVALATATGLFSAVATSPAEAGDPPQPTGTLSVDCDTATAGVQNSCSFAPGTLTVNIVFENTGVAAVELGAVQFEITAPQLTFDPPAGADANLNSNPNFSESGIGAVGTWSCTPPGVDNDTDASSTVANSLFPCFESTGTATTVAAGASVLAATVTYTTLAGQGDLVLNNADVGDADGFPIILSCTTGILAADACNDANVTITGVVADTPTPGPSATPTATPCLTCPTATSTSLAFITVTPTPGGETATAVPGGEQPTTVPGGEQPGGNPPPTGGNPGGGAGAGGAGPIRLPDTGDGSGGVNWSGMSLVMLAALAAGGLAGGTYFYAARRVTARRDGE